MQITLTIESYSLARMTDFSDVRAVIFLFDQKNDIIGRLAFYESNVPTHLHMTSGYPTLHYPIAAFAELVDILRNEAPTSLVYSELVGYGRVITGKEPVGEGENVTT